MGLLIISSMIVLGGMYLIFAFVWWILLFIVFCFIFTKAGEAGWKSLIPIYGDYVSYKIAWQTSYFWLNFILGILLSYVSNANLNESMFLSLIVILLKIALTVINIMYCVKLARAFGRGIGFAIGLILLQPIFLLILGFGSDQYYGADR